MNDFEWNMGHVASTHSWFEDIWGIDLRDLRGFGAIERTEGGNFSVVQLKCKLPQRPQNS